MGLVNGTNDMTWNLTDLAQDQTYTFDWRVEYNNDDVLYMHETWDTDDNSSRLIDWDLEINTSAVCNARIEFRAYIDMTGDGEWVMMESGSFYENFECDQQVYPSDHYVTIHGEVNGTWVAEPDPLPFGYDVISLGFENLTVDEEYQMYFYHSGTGFDSSSEWFTFTYEGGLLGYRMPIAPWACTIQYNYNLYQVDFRGNSNWYMGSDNVNLDGPCLTMSYDSSAATNLAVTDSAGTPWTTTLPSTRGKRHHPAGRGAPSGLPLLHGSEVLLRGIPQPLRKHRVDGGQPDQQHNDRRDRRARIRLRRNHLLLPIRQNPIWQQPAELHHQRGERSLRRLRILFRRAAHDPAVCPLEWDLDLVDDDTAIPPGTTEMFWDISMLDNETTVYFYQGGNHHWSGHVDGTDHPIEWEWEVSEFDYSPYVYSRIEFDSDWTGRHSTGSHYTYLSTDCLDGGNMSLDIQGDDGNWTSYDSNQGYDYHLMPGTTSMSWNFTDLIEGYEYEFYWYVNSEYYCESQTRATPRAPLMTPTWHTSTSRLARTGPGRCRST